MSKQIYICEYCGALELRHFGQCKHCDTHDNGSKYINFEKVEVKQLLKDDLMILIKKFNSVIIDNKLYEEDKMEKDFVKKELERNKREIIEEIEKSIESKIGNIKIDIPKDDDKFKDYKKIKIENDYKKTIEGLEKLNKTYLEKFEEKSKDNKLIEKKVKELELKNKELLLTLDDLTYLVTKLKKNVKVIKKVEVKEEVKPKIKVKKVKKVKPKIKVKKVKEEVKPKIKVKKVKKKVKSEKNKSIKLVKDISIENLKQRSSGWNKEENEITIKCYNKNIKKTNEMSKLYDKIIKELNKKGYKRTLSAVQRRLYRLKQRKLIE